MAAELKILRGNPGHRPVNGGTPIAGPLSERAPRELKGEARLEWRRTIAPAIRSGAITAADRALAIQHCELWAELRELMAEAAGRPHVIAIGPNAYPTPNPARTAANKTRQILIRTDSELGLSPASRSKVTTGRIPVAGPVAGALDRFLAGKAPGA